MLTKTKIGIGVLVLVAFVSGGFALNAFDVDAFGWAKFGNGDSEEWKAKMEEFKAMTLEERQELREQCMGNGDCPHPREFKNGFGPLKMFGDEINHEVITLDNGIQITITSDNADIVQKLHDFAEKINSLE